MKKSRRTRNKLLASVALSSASMVWMLWHFPVGTSIATVSVLLAFAMLVRVSRAMDTDVLAGDLGPDKLST